MTVPIAKIRGALALSFLFAASCTKAPPDDPICSYEPLPETAGVPAEQGAVMISGSTNEYIHLTDPAGKQLTSGRVGAALKAKPGEYRARLNSSIHPVFVRAKTLTKCAAGAVLISGGTDEYYYVHEVAAGTQLASSKIGQAAGLFPGKYRILVNRTSAEVEIKPGAVSELKAALLLARGSTDEYYYVLDSAGTQLASSKLSAPLSLLPAKLTLKINNATAPLEITPGATVELQTGALMVRGTTDEYYYVLDAAGNQLASSKLNQAVSFVAGAYTVRVNNVKMPAKVEAGKTSEYQTATLTVKASANNYYYVLDANGTNLASKRLNESLAIPEGSYSVKVGDDTRPVTLSATKTVVVNW